MQVASPSFPKLVYLCDWLPPEYGAVGQDALRIARERAADGLSIALYGLSSSADSIEQEHPGAAALKVVRLKMPVYDRTNFRARAWWTLKTNLALLWSARADLRACSDILFTGSPPFMLHLLAPLNLLLGKKLTYRITDFFPECMIAEYEKPPLALRLVYRLTLFWRRRVSQFEVLGEDQKRRLLETGIPAERIVVRRNASPVSILDSTRPLPRPAAFEGRKILLYSGNFGVAHDYVTFLDGFRKHHRNGSGHVAFWLNAVGSRADALEAALVADKLPHLRTRPVPVEQLASLLVTPDAHLIALGDRFSGYVLPSKVHACIDSKKPILFIGPSTSDVHLLCSTHLPPGAYTRVNVGDSDGVAKALEAM